MPSAPVLLGVGAEERHLARRAPRGRARAARRRRSPRPVRSAASTQMTSSTPRATPRQRSPITARLQSFSTSHGRAQAALQRRAAGWLPRARERAAEEDLAARRASIPPVHADAGRQQLVALRRRRPCSTPPRVPAARPRAARGPPLGPKLAPSLRRRSARAGRRPRRATLCSPMSDRRARARRPRGTPRRRAGRPRAAPRRLVVVDLRDPAEPQQVVDDRVDRRARQARGGDAARSRASGPPRAARRARSPAFMRRRSFGSRWRGLVRRHASQEYFINDLRQGLTTRAAEQLSPEGIS